MVYTSFSKKETVVIDYRSIWGVLLFSLSVSIDSLSVGVSLGLFATDIIMTVLLFGLFGGVMSVLGLLVGRNAGKWAGQYGEALGGIILIAFGIRFLI
jgi:putative Mn2+ efflux pump MntP